MLGAIIGDTVGSIYEFDNIKTTDFPLFSERSEFTDDSIMSVAVADWLLRDKMHTRRELEASMERFADEYPTRLAATAARSTSGCSADASASPTTRGATARQCV
jgi:ADP-ribosylglycohydrolase